MSIGKRIKESRLRAKITQKQLASKCGWGDAHTRIGNYESDSRIPKPNDIQSLARALNVSEKYLYLGELDMYIDIFHAKHTKLEMHKYMLNSQNLYVFTATDETMSSSQSPSIPKGAIVLCEKSNQIKNGLMVIEVSGETKIRDVLIDSSIVYLRALNKDYVTTNHKTEDVTPIAKPISCMIPLL